MSDENIASVVALGVLAVLGFGAMLLNPSDSEAQIVSTIVGAIGGWMARAAMSDK